MNWLDLILPPETVRADETHFERRFGLGYAEPLIRIRFLDQELARRLGFPVKELALPLGAVDAGLDVKRLKSPPTVYVVENLVNALTLPEARNALVLTGMGYAVELLRYLNGLRDCPTIRYWGDIDAQGFEILSRFRALFPQVESRLMDRATFDEFARFQTAGSSSSGDEPRHLTDEEKDTWLLCHEKNPRLEQEKIQQSWVLRKLRET